jgi:hypothetical protein
VAVATEGSGGIGAEPVAAGFASRIDALHRKAGQKLHFLSPRGRKAQVDLGATVRRSRLRSSEFPLAAKPLCEKSAVKSLRQKCSGQANVMAGIVACATCGVKRKGYKILW